MMKGQDTVALPLIALGDTDEDELLENLKNMSTNGLRTLVCGFAELDPSWWSQRSAAYQEIITRDSSPASEGHPAKCKPSGCEKCAQHDFFEQVEKDAGLQYAGCIGLEDQLQLLVPECIGDCIRGGIKVWMITGDKLETAKNIGLAWSASGTQAASQWRASSRLRGFAVLTRPCFVCFQQSDRSRHDPFLHLR